MFNFETSDKQVVTITDIRIPFWSWVRILFTAAVAAIPAAILLFGILFVLTVFASVFFVNLQQNLTPRSAAPVVRPVGE